METIIKNNFIAFLNEGIDNGGFHNDDIIAIAMPLLQEVLTFHEQGKVAPLEGLKHILITNNLLDIDEQFIKSPTYNKSKISEISTPVSTVFNIIDETKRTTDVEESTMKEINLSIQLEKDKEITKPVYLPGYVCYEFLIGHHDALSDIFVLGLIIGSLAAGLDLNNEDDLKTFVDNRSGLVYLNSKIHPAIANIVMEMTELDRKKRARDLHEVIEKLKNYRDYNPEKEIDLTSLEGFKNQDISTRSKWILNKLKSRLFDISRRNRLLYFKNSSKFLNLTVSSVPTTLNYKNIDPNSLFIWNDDIASKIKNGKQIALSKYLKTEDNPYIPSILDKIRSESTRDVNEYGFSQLRLIICSLNWYNLKENKYEKINSPLLLVPVELKKKKGIKDQYTLDITGNEAEVNPVLVYWLKELYDIKLPDSIVLDDFEMNKLYQNIQDQIKSSNSGISIEFIDKPRIKLIYSLAKQTLSQFNRKLKRNKNLSHYKEVDYSYQRENFQPLGLSIFKKKIEPTASYLEFLINEDVKLSTYNVTTIEKERSLFSLVDEGNTNPYLWEFDTCNMTLGNFNYKKMSLVRDYNEVMDENINDPIFEQLFSDQPKSILNKQDVEKENLKEKYHIISCDPTQSDAIKMAKAGHSYIIQGPPGTGKSQTITNLIADYIARGKRVLFVCEKRAAIDVVFYRLKQQKLDELCCRIHDSQADKKEFIMNLKETYNDFMKHPLPFLDIEKERNQIIASIETELSSLEKYNHTITKEFENVGTSLLKLIERLIELKNNHVAVSFEIEELIPGYKEWILNSDLIHQLAKQLKDSDHEPYISSHPASILRKQALKQEHPINYIKQLTEQLEDLFEFISNGLSKVNIPAHLMEHFLSIQELVNDAHRFKPYAENGNLFLYDSNHASTKQFEGIVFDYQELKNKVAAANKKNNNWKNKFSEGDLLAATEQLTTYQGSFFSFLNPGFWKLKKTINSSYDFSKHDVKPSFKQVLDELQAEYNLHNQSVEIEKKAAFTFKITNINDTWETIEKFRKEKHKPSLSYLSNANQEQLILALCSLKDKVETAAALLDQSIQGYEQKNVIDLLEDIENIKLSLKTLPELLPLINELNETAEKFQAFVKKGEYSPEQFESLMAEKSLKGVYQLNKEFHKTEAADIRYSIQKLKLAYEKLYEINASYIRAKIRKNFNDNIALSTKTASGLSLKEKEFKKTYTEGRKIVEHEFNKSMRYRSIRDLASKESGKIIQDLKPVWLMSPLSVSDTLPLNPEYFDVVIFDEASQITLEEGIPPLFRGKQTIIVGDEMQMPPSNFFGSVAPDEEDDSTDDEHESMRIDADSLLTQGARKLQDVMLGWHYRSKYESLISFSNAAFYNRNLLTIPDQTIPPEDLTEVKANAAENAIENATTLYNRSISFHYMEHGVYDKRTNTSEAEYIAQLIRTLLNKGDKQSIGVVAFSQEQQYEIENALIRLGSSDKDFENKLEEEYQRQEEGQFVGLFVKNLENVQGDERDIIIMSVCYGHDHNKRMIMNFGPINRKGGEKRLNVIFSRAKKHMAIISSIKYTDIKNEYNEGANYFRKFLQYAESISLGELKSANLTLDGLSKNNITDASVNLTNVIVLGIAKELNAIGYKTDLNVGQSFFRCNIGVRNKENNNNYCLGILIDTIEHYKNNNLLEQYVLRPAILKSFNWNIIQVYSKDWLHQPEKVMEQIIKALQGKSEEEEIRIPKSNSVIKEDKKEEESIDNNAKMEEPIIASVSENGIHFKRLNFKDDTSDKFWEIAQDDIRMIVRFGKTGTKGQENVKIFETAAQTKIEIEKLTQQKIKKGYLA
jgi:superfamily I DNA and/or RNA helicase/predicted DNA-binding WGR domain protein